MLAATLAAGLGMAVVAQAQAVSAISADDLTLGDPKAKVTVIEYASASCPHCARFNNEVFPAFKAKYVDTGKVYYVFRSYLTQPIEVAGAGALLARCAAKDQAFAVIDTFFKGQQHMYDTGDLRSALLAAGAAGGLSPAQVDACLADEAAVKALNARVQHYLDRDKINETPTFVIGDQRLAGEQTLAELDDAIAKAEARHSSHRRRH
jgi:protein-disulfide isomerase